MSDLQKGFTFTTGAPDNEVTAAKLNQLVDNGSILVGFYSGKPVKTATDSGDKLLLLDSISGEFRQITVTNAIPAAIVPDPHLFWNGTTNVTVSNTVTETSVLSSGSGSLTISAGYLTAGARVSFNVAGTYTRRASQTDKISWKLKFGSVVVASISRPFDFDSANESSDSFFSLDFGLTIRTAGATGTLVSNAKQSNRSGETSVFRGGTFINSITSPVTIDTTGTNVVDLTAQWNVADAGNSVTVSQATLTIARI